RRGGAGGGRGRAAGAGGAGARRRRAPARAQPLSRHLPEAGHRPDRALGAPSDLQRRARQQLQGARRRQARHAHGELRRAEPAGAGGPVITSLLTQARDVPTIRTPTVDWLPVGAGNPPARAAVPIVLLRSLVRRGKWGYPASLVLAFSGVIAAGALLVRQWREVQDHGAITTIAGMLRVDGFGVFLGGVVVVAALLALLLSVSY